MREAAFIKSNREKWRQIELESANKEIPAEALADNFVELTDDLSYARTFYPSSQTVRYLNKLTGHYFIGLYQYRQRTKGRFARFWTKELPHIMYRFRKYMLYSCIALVAGMLLGAFSQSQDSDFVNLALSPGYVNMTLENIEKGNPMGVYEDDDQMGMYLAISTNNIRVAFLAFILGVLFSVGTVWLLFYNGIVLGAFQYFFFERGLLWECSSALWLHGTLEISAIIIAGGAGIALGNSILFPGSYKRIVSVQRVAKSALKIAVGLIPVFVVAAIIESYVTHYYMTMPVALNVTIIVLSALFIMWYFFYYPYKLNNNNNNNNIDGKPRED